MGFLSQRWEVRGELGDNAHDVGLFHDEEVLPVDLDLGAGPLAEQDAIALLEVDRDQLAGLVAAAGTDGEDLLIMKESDIMGVLTDLPAARKKAA